MNFSIRKVREKDDDMNLKQNKTNDGNSMVWILETISKLNTSMTMHLQRISELEEENKQIITKQTNLKVIE
jgi:hypothetical protein